ncbi:MAG TPA: hypothetical protein PKK59_04110 [Anaerolineaceae bacterium]|nr:hypothetical protein [Anaerolineaceae bacterium]
MENWINYLTVTLLTVALFGLILADSRRITVIAYGVVVLLLFSINIQFWSFGFALSKLLTGIMAMLILALTPTEETNVTSINPGTGRIFNIVSFGFCIILVLFTINRTSGFLAIELDQSIPALLILLCGFILLGISQESYRIIIGLLTVLIGFEVLYSAIEQSLLINGLLTAVELLIALVGSYLLTPINEGEEE